MTSNDTYSRALELLESSDYFRMKPTQVHFLKQTKSHGHGDVHSLLYSSSLLKAWYTGREFFLEPPSIYMCNGIWKLCLPDEMQSDKMEVGDMSFTSCDEIFNKNRDDSSLAGFHASHISQKLLLHSGQRMPTHIGALILEPGVFLLVSFLVL